MHAPRLSREREGGGDHDKRQRESGAWSKRVGAETVEMPDLEGASGKDGKDAYTEKTGREIVPEGGISRYSEPQHDTALA